MIARSERAEPTIERAPREEHVGAAHLVQGPRAGRFVVSILLGLVVLLGGATSLNAVVDPYGLLGTHVFPTAVEEDRRAKLDLIDRLSSPPELVVLGNSRARQADPAFLEELTGLRHGFNAAVTDGRAADTWAFLRYLDHRPLPGRAYVWFVDQWLGDDTVNPVTRADARTSPFVGGRAAPARTAGTLREYASIDAVEASARVIRACVEHGGCPSGTHFEANGSFVRRYRVAATPAFLRRSIANQLPGASKRPRSPTFASYWRSLGRFRQILGWMNDHGSTPVLVVDPIHPTLLAAYERWGFPRRQRGLRALALLHRRYRFVVVDTTELSSFGGSPDGFTDARHLDERNMQKVLRHVVASSGDVLRRRPVAGSAT